MGRLATLLVSLVMTSGCQSEKSRIVEKCEGILLPTLKAPSSYKLIDPLIGLPEKDGSRNVFLKYDAVNSYNAPLRDTFWCVVKKSGEVEPGGGGVDAIADNMEALADNIADAALPDNAPNPFAEKPASPETPVTPTMEEDEVPVCDRPDSPEKTALMNEIGVDCLGE